MAAEMGESRDYMTSSWREVATLHAKLDAVLTKKTDKGSRELDVGELHQKLDMLLDGSTRSAIGSETTFSSMSDLQTRSPLNLSASTAASPSHSGRPMAFSGSTSGSPMHSVRSLKVKPASGSLRVKPASTSVPPSIMLSGSTTPATRFVPSRGCSGATSPPRTSGYRNVASPPPRVGYRSGYVSPPPKSLCSGATTPCSSVAIRSQRTVRATSPGPVRTVVKTLQAPIATAAPPVSTVPMPAFLVPVTPAASLSMPVTTSRSMLLTWPTMMLQAGPTMLMQSQSQVLVPFLKPRSSRRNGGSPDSSRSTTPIRSQKTCCG